MEEKEQETGGGRQDEQSRFPGFVVVDFQQGMLKALPPAIAKNLPGPLNQDTQL